MIGRLRRGLFGLAFRSFFKLFGFFRRLRLHGGAVGVDLLALQSLGTLFVVASLALSKRFLGCMRCRLRARTRRGLFACIGIQNLVVDNRLHFFLRLLEFVERNTQRFCHFGQLVGAKNQEREQQDYE